MYDQDLTTHHPLLKQKQHESQALPQGRSQELQTTASVKRHMHRIRLLSLAAVMVIVTLGLVASLFYLSWAAQMEQASPKAVLDAHLPVLGNMIASLPSSVLPAVGLGTILASLTLLYGRNGFAFLASSFVRTPKAPPMHRASIPPTPGAHAFDQVRSRLDLPTAISSATAAPYPPLPGREVFSRKPIGRTNGTFDTSPPSKPQVFVETALMQIYAQTLEVPVEYVKGTTHFFEAGGDSERLQKLLRMVAQRLRVTLIPEEIFDHPVAYRLAAVIVQKQMAEREHMEPSLSYREEVYA